MVAHFCLETSMAFLKNNFVEKLNIGGKAALWKRRHPRHGQAAVVAPNSLLALWLMSSVIFMRSKSI
jgi:hypothetical protein